MQKKRFLHLAILFALILAAIKFVFLPLSDWKAEMVAQNQALAQNISKAKELWKNREALESSLSEVDAQLDEIRTVVPLVRAEDAKKFQLKQQQVIEKIVKGTDIKIKTLAWLPITSPFFHQIPVKIRGQGSPRGFYQIIRQLEMRPEFVDINSLYFRRVGRGGDLIGDIEVSFYALDPERVESG